jgi:hypothetical protein
MAGAQIESEPHHDATEINQTVRRTHRLRCQRILGEVNFKIFYTRYSDTAYTQMQIISLSTNAGV